MRASPVRPVAVRATAFRGTSRWRRRPVRFVGYDALLPNGSVQFDVDLAWGMPAHPADASTRDVNVHDRCPEVGAGPWVDGFGRAVDGPVDAGPPLSARRRARPRPTDLPRRRASAKSGRRWRAGLGVAAIGLGILIVVGPLRDTPAGFVGVVCALAGLAALLDLIPRAGRWW
ncbi:hypothetical protein [Plantibacter sp. Leaf314]|uniref:hypothetical protein n=1 Tax=Plantibacter sp. Leaf314 TaxID=1736333 RepID=UPI0006F8A82B|nr:hypothetical protein [Plantibacter sp. Leaf314]KQQ51690.1 hypothetical protein ASF68_04480 [Plantibacter sp. Leaf314]